MGDDALNLKVRSTLRVRFVYVHSCKVNRKNCMQYCLSINYPKTILAIFLLGSCKNNTCVHKKYRVYVPGYLENESVSKKGLMSSTSLHDAEHIIPRW